MHPLEKNTVALGTKIVKKLLDLFIFAFLHIVYIGPHNIPNTIAPLI